MKKTPSKNIDPVVEDNIETVILDTFDSMRDDDPESVFYDYEFNSDGSLDIDVMALGKIELQQQKINIKSFVKQVKMIDGVVTVDVSKWSGNGTEDTPYYAKVSVTTGTPDMSKRSEVEKLVISMFDGELASFYEYEILDKTMIRFLTSFGALSIIKPLAKSFKSAALKLPSVSDVNITEISPERKTRNCLGQRAGRLQIIITTH